MVDLEAQPIFERNALCSSRRLPGFEKDTETKKGTEHLPRWPLRSLEFTCEILHRSNAQHQAAYALSRLSRKKK